MNLNFFINSIIFTTSLILIEAGYMSPFDLHKNTEQLSSSILKAFADEGGNQSTDNAEYRNLEASFKLDMTGGPVGEAKHYKSYYDAECSSKINSRHYWMAEFKEILVPTYVHYTLGHSRRVVGSVFHDLKLLGWLNPGDTPNIFHGYTGRISSSQQFWIRMKKSVLIRFLQIIRTNTKGCLELEQVYIFVLTKKMHEYVKKTHLLSAFRPVRAHASKSTCAWKANDRNLNQNYGNCVYMSKKNNFLIISFHILYHTEYVVLYTDNFYGGAGTITLSSSFEGLEKNDFVDLISYKLGQFKGQILTFPYAYRVSSIKVTSSLVLSICELSVYGTKAPNKKILPKQSEVLLKVHPKSRQINQYYASVFNQLAKTTFKKVTEVHYRKFEVSFNIAESHETSGQEYIEYTEFYRAFYDSHTCSDYKSWHLDLYTPYIIIFFYYKLDHHQQPGSSLGKHSVETWSSRYRRQRHMLYEHKKSTTKADQAFWIISEDPKVADHLFIRKHEKMGCFSLMETAIFVLTEETANKVSTVHLLSENKPVLIKAKTDLCPSVANDGVLNQNKKQCLVISEKPSIEILLGHIYDVQYIVLYTTGHTQGQDNPIYLWRAISKIDWKDFVKVTEYRFGTFDGQILTLPFNSNANTVLISSEKRLVICELRIYGK